MFRIWPDVIYVRVIHSVVLRKKREVSFTLKILVSFVWCVCLSTCQPFCLRVCPFACPAAFLPASLWYVCPSVFSYSPICRSVCLRAYLSVSVGVHQLVSLYSVSLSMTPYVYPGPHACVLVCYLFIHSAQPFIFFLQQLTFGAS